MMRMRLELAGVERLALAGALLMGLSLWAGPAAALMPPYVYENARNDAASVIIIAVETVTMPARAYGSCAVKGTVAKVERGSTYRMGQKVTVDVPCARPDARPPIGGTIYQQTQTLAVSKFGRAYLDAKGQVVLSQYQQLAGLP